MSNLKKSRVQKLIQSYGANPNRWPQAEQQAGKKWLKNNPLAVQKMLVEASELDQSLNNLWLPAGETALLQARILRAAKNTPQDGVSDDIAVNDTAPTVLSAWKAVAATLVLTTGVGFGIGRVAAADTSYSSAEALLSMSMQSGYIENDLLGDGA